MKAQGSLGRTVLQRVKRAQLRAVHAHVAASPEYELKYQLPLRICSHHSPKLRFGGLIDLAYHIAKTMGIPLWVRMRRARIKPCPSPVSPGSPTTSRAASRTSTFAAERPSC
jgi:hypothetical protein